MESGAPIPERLRWQAEWCKKLGSPLYTQLLEAAAIDVEAGGPVAAVLRGREGDRDDSMLALRFMGALHRLVLTGEARELAAFYPSAGGDAPKSGLVNALVGTCERLRDELRILIMHPVQTNEVARSGALIGGFLEVARFFAKPLRVLEIGSSAGLNLRFDHFHYEARGATWGPTDSPLHLCDFNSERALPFDVQLTIAERAGCDPRPLDPTTEEGRLTLMSYLWADQVRRLRLLKAAIEVARVVPARVEQSRAAPWLKRELAVAPDGITTVVFHSIVWQYLSEEERAEVSALLDEAGTAASEHAPLAWLRMEPGGEQAEIRLTTWPPSRERLLATSGFHGAGVRWLG